jgi:hypothetical protein
VWRSQVRGLDQVTYHTLQYTSAKSDRLYRQRLTHQPYTKETYHSYNPSKGIVSVGSIHGHVIQAFQRLDQPATTATISENQVDKENTVQNSKGQFNEIVSSCKNNRH